VSTKFIPLSVPNLKGNELKYVTHAVETEWVSSGGQYIIDFETQFADFLDAPKAVAVQSGTAALHLALMEAGVQPGEEVIAPTLTFIAAVNPIRYCGAEPVFMDCDDSLCMDPVKLKRFLTKECTFDNGILTNNKTGKRIRALVVVHVFGNIADMEAIIPIAEALDLAVIEDATEALGSKYVTGKYEGVHAGLYGDYGAFSFNGNKIMTTGGGGMLVAKNNEHLNHMQHISTQAKENPVNFIHDEVGYNYRLTNLQAALGLGQIEQLNDFIQTKHDNYAYYLELFKDNPNVELVPFREGTESNKWFYALYIKNRADIQAIMDQLQASNIQTRPIWGLIHQQKPYQKNESFEISKAIDYSQHIINIPCSTNLSKEDVAYVAACINKLTLEEESL